MEAAGEGFRDIVEDMIARGVDDYDEIAVAAARGGYEEIVEAMIARGAGNSIMELLS
jgi:hypothetical protein